MNLNKEIEKTMNHTYLVLSKNTYFDESEDDYRMPMVLQNKIPGLLEVSQQALNGDNKLYYEISSLVSLEEAFANKEMDYQSVRELFAGCVNIFSNIEAFMLDGQQIVLTPEYIYIDNQTKKPYFVFNPDYYKDARESFNELIEYVLEKLDHDDETTVMLGYNIYRITRNSNFTMQEIENVLVEKRESISQKISEDIMEEEFDFSDGYSDDTVILTPEIRETWSQTNGWKDKLKVKDKLDLKKISPAAKISLTHSSEVIGMIASGIVMSILCGFLLYGVNMNLFNIYDRITLYILGAIAMSFMTILMLAYTYTKKRKQVLS